MPRQSLPAGCGNYGPAAVSRREMLKRSGLGFGSLALAGLLAEEGLLSAAEGRPQVAGRAKRVICLFMGGGPSQVDTFDPKPLLKKLNGQDVPEEIAKDVPRIARAPLHNLLASPFQFQRHGECGMPISELYPEIARHADELCVIRSMRHTTPIHAPAEYMALTGTQIGNRPSLGAWLLYGMGSENKNLPGFVVFNSDGSGRPPGWGAGFLPARFQGTVMNNDGTIPNLPLPESYTRDERIAQLKLVERLNRAHLERHQGNSELEARIRSYELSFRMQVSAPEAFDLSQETAETRSLYGLDQKETEEFGRHCLLTRRLIERGVRFIQLRRGRWDAHSKIEENHRKQSQSVDRPIAGLITDLKRRGMLDETLLVWGGEFGRTPTAQGEGANAGRDHSPSGYSLWLAGGGVQGGQIIGATDPVGYAAIENPIHPNDLHATLLHALGIDQHELFYEHHNRRELVTVNGGTVVKQVFGQA